MIKAIKQKDLKPIVVPQYEELSPKKIYAKIKKFCPEILVYLPEYKDKQGYLPPKKFMWDVFSTLDSDLALKFIKFSIDQRAEEEKEGDKTIEVSEDVLKEMESVNYFSKKKGKALYMLKASKDYTNIQRKRRREFISFDPENKEKPKNPFSKRTKVTETSNKKTTNPFAKKTKEKKETEKRLDEDKSGSSDMEIGIEKEPRYDAEI